MSAWLKKLIEMKEDRGLMAELRCYLVDSKKHRAYSALHYLGIPVDSESESLSAALYALHPMEDGTLKNFGATAKLIKNAKDDKYSDNSKQTPTERRFQHLLSAEHGKELYERIIRLIMLAKTNEISVNYEQLQKDLLYKNNWKNRTRREWATEFWKITTSQPMNNESQPNGDES